METLKSWVSNPDEIIALAIEYGSSLLMAILTLVIGLWVISKLTKGLAKMFKTKNFDQTLQTFLLSMVGIGLKIMLLISVIGMLGIEMTSFIAVLGALGLAVGMALSGTLQNFAGGVMLLIFKPFKVGDYIEAQGYAGMVKEIQIFNTILNTPDKKTIIIPNGGLSTNAMTNYSTEPQRRVDFTFGIGYGDDIDKARNIILEVISKEDRILKDPAPFVGVESLGDSSVNLATRVWGNAADYWDIFFKINETVKKTFDQQGISIPFPQQDVHVFKSE